MHTYLKKEAVYQGQVTLLGNTLKNKKGEDTSEAVHIQTLKDITDRTNWRDLPSMKHTPKQRKFRKILVKQGANRNFANNVVAKFW